MVFHKRKGYLMHFTVYCVSGTLGLKIPRFCNDSDYVHILLWRETPYEFQIIRKWVFCSGMESYLSLLRFYYFLAHLLYIIQSMSLAMKQSLIQDGSSYINYLIQKVSQRHVQGHVFIQTLNINKLSVQIHFTSLYVCIHMFMSVCVCVLETL